VRRRCSSPDSPEPIGELGTGLRAGALSSRLILASASPQRRAALARLGVAFEVQPSEVAELERGKPDEVALENALRKARAVREARRVQAEAVRGAGTSQAVAGAAHTEAVRGAQRSQAVTDAVHSEAVLGVDTLVALGGEIYGKPADEARARATLQALSGATHRVISGVALLLGGEERTAVSCTEVSFREVGAELLEWLLAKGEWRERSGGYAIQGASAVLVREVRGDYENVVGLPLATLLDIYPELLNRLG
jgi:septum formation protein